jgi:hypothetical protein
MSNDGDEEVLTESEDDGTIRKLCTMCNEKLELNSFRKCKEGTHGVGNRCKPCWKKWYKDRVDNDLEYKKTLAKQRADNHIENKEKYNERHKVDFRQNKVRIYARRKKYYLAHPDKALAELHRQHLRNILKSGKESPDLLGCNTPFLKLWFDLHFSIDTEFSIANHGNVWHIDHVIPINKWDLSNEEHKKLCFNWKNLMPLRAGENISKHDNIDLAQVTEQNRRLKLFGKIRNRKYPKTPIHMVQQRNPQLLEVPKALTTADQS